MMAEQVESKARETLVREISALKATVQDYKDSQTFLSKRNRQLEDRLGQQEFENNSLKSKNNNLQAEFENQTAIQANLKSLNKKRKKDTEFLSLEVHALKCKLAQCYIKRDEESRENISSPQQNESMANELAEMKSLAAKQQQLICELKDRLRMKRENINENTNSSENQGDDSLLVNILEYHTDETEDVDPVPDVQNRTLCFRRGTNLLKVGLGFGISIVGTLLVTGMIQVFAGIVTGSDCYLSVQENIFSLHYITPPPI